MRNRNTILNVFAIISAMFILSVMLENLIGRPERSTRQLNFPIKEGDKREIGKMLQYDSCSCVVVILQDGRFGRIRGEDCTPQSALFHYTEGDIELIWEATLKK
jgi:hypothetical protein